MGWDKSSVRSLRIRLGLTQAEFSRRLGCRQQTISEWEQGLYAPANAYGKLLDMMNSQAPQSLPEGTNIPKSSAPDSSPEIINLTSSALSQFDQFFSSTSSTVSFDPSAD